MESEIVSNAISKECPPASRPQGDNGDTADTAACSKRNVEEWQSYLSPECVASMIRMGWDRST